MHRKTPKRTLQVLGAAAALLMIATPAMAAFTFVMKDQGHLQTPLDSVSYDRAASADWVFLQAADYAVKPEMTLCFYDRHGFEITCIDGGYKYMKPIPFGTSVIEVSMNSGLDVNYNFAQLRR